MGMNQINTDYPGAPQSGAVETASRTQLRQWQEERLVSLYQRTWKYIPFYRKRWEKDGLGPDDIRSLDDVAKLPVGGYGWGHDGGPGYGIQFTAMAKLIYDLAKERGVGRQLPLEWFQQNVNS